MGISPTTIRYYESQGLFEFKRNNENQYRTFDEADIALLLQIKALRNRGYTLKQIKRIYLDGHEDDTIELYSELIRECDEQIKKLKTEKSLLIADIDRIRNDKSAYVIRPAKYAMIYLSFEDILSEQTLRQSMQKWLDTQYCGRPFFRFGKRGDRYSFELGMSETETRAKENGLDLLPGVIRIEEYPCIRKKVTIHIDHNQEDDWRNAVIKNLSGYELKSEDIYGYLLTSNQDDYEYTYVYEILIPII